jgi:acyl-CoA reductase-like NAD-dependent aldehyde dehydrogenase/nicotinamidase-related amidase
MNPVLLLLDLQRELQTRSRLVPPATALREQALRLLTACREIGVPVVHLQTHAAEKVGPSVGFEAPEDPGTDDLRPLIREPVLTNPFPSAFACGALDAALREQSADTVLVAGLETHEGVRTTVLDAQSRGYAAIIADDAVGSTEPEHAEISRIYLTGKGAAFLDTASLLTVLSKCKGANCKEKSSEQLALGISASGNRPAGNSGRVLERRNPSCWQEVIGRVCVAESAEVGAAAEAAALAQKEWSRLSPAMRQAALHAWAVALADQSAELVELLVREIGKPFEDSRAEVSRSLALLRSTVEHCTERAVPSVDAANVVHACDRPCGVIGLITPWNNPIAIPVGKIAPALAHGNAVLWKPAVEAPGTVLALMETLRQADLPAGLVNPVFGNAATARLVIDHPRVAAVTLTGSIASGRSAAVRCTRLGKPLQAELGGNNAAIVWRHADIEADVGPLARAAFAFSGQRCTAIRRFIVERSLLPRFQHAFVAAVESLRLGHPADSTTDIGPLVSRSHRAEVSAVLRQAAAEGGQVLCGGTIPAGLESGCWLSPAIVGRVGSGSSIAQEETFGPVAVLFPADSLDEAIALANGVEQGLVAAVVGCNEEEKRRCANAIEAGILQFAPGPVDVHPQAPFGGWKASGLGPPEHGAWDRQFYTRPQAVYGSAAPKSREARCSAPSTRKC